MMIRKIRLVIILAVTLTSALANAEVKSLCDKSESTIWSCQTSKKIYSLCASQDLATSVGYLQYRAGTSKNIEFRFPITLQHPKGYFEFGLLPRGASLTFSNSEYTYYIAEPLIGQPVIEISKAGKAVSSLQCSESTQSLTENTTINLFKTTGVSQ